MSICKRNDSFPVSTLEAAQLLLIAATLDTARALLDKSGRPISFAKIGCLFRVKFHPKDGLASYFERISLPKD